jgi:hypothetical protein
MLDEKIETFLRARTGGVKHSGRTLFDHLVGTYALLKQRKAPEYVCLAGLFHSIYGTNIFRHQAVPFTDRVEIIELIGPLAERLAFIFSSCNRPSALVEAVKDGPPYRVVNRLDMKTIMPLSGEDMFDLLLIEIANLEEQGGGQMLAQVQRAYDKLVSSILLDT